MSMKEALFVSLAAGAAVRVALLLWSAWTLRNGKRTERGRRWVYSGTAVIMLGVPLALMIQMPDLKRAFVAWIGFFCGMAVSTPLTLPLGYLIARSIERRVGPTVR